MISASAQHAASISADRSAKLSLVKGLLASLAHLHKMASQSGVYGHGVAYRVLHALDFLV